MFGVRRSARRSTRALERIVAANSRSRRSEIAFLELVAPLMFGDFWSSGRIDFSTCSDRQIEILLSDVADWARGLSKTQVAEIDQSLLEANLPTLSIMMDKSIRTVRRILRRGKIRSGDEFRLVSGLLADTTTQALTVEDRAIAENLLGDYQGSADENAL